MLARIGKVAGARIGQSRSSALVPERNWLPSVPGAITRQKPPNCRKWAAAGWILKPSLRWSQARHERLMTINDEELIGRAIRSTLRTLEGSKQLCQTLEQTRARL